jgi:hypothetical protein
MKDVDAAWLAAAMDGEGTISISKRRKSRFVMFGLYNNNLEFIQKGMNIIRSCYGDVGGINVKRQKSGKNYYSFIFSRSDIIKLLLLDLKSFLIVKRHNAEICLDFIDGKFKEDDVIELNNDRPSTSKNANNSAKGWRGDSEAHRRAALCAVNHHLKGFRGNSKGHCHKGHN